MKLSDAILLGSMLKPQAFGKYFNKELGSTCAWGAAFDACGLDMNKPWRDPFTWAHSFKVLHPIQKKFWYLGSAIANLNDTYKWSRERIAAWVATVEPKDPQDFPKEAHKADYSFVDTEQTKDMQVASQSS